MIRVLLYFFRQWCSTKVDKFNEHIGGENNWGFCRESCLIIDNTNHDHSSGLWKPSGIRKECGTNVNIRKKRALGGTNAKPGDFPYNALIGKESENSVGIYYSTAGTVINKWYILTGAKVLVGSPGIIT